MNLVIGIRNYSVFLVSVSVDRERIPRYSVRLPKVDGQPVDLNPEKVFDSPFMSSEHASGMVTIRKGERVLTIDMAE